MNWRKKASIFVGKFMARPSVVYARKHGARGGVCVEVGVFQGDNADHIYKKLHPSKMILIDNWKADGSGEYAQETLDNAEECVRMTWFGHKDVPIVKGDSSTELANIPMADYIYIDGDHSYDGVLKDLNAAWPKVRPGRVLAGHDISTPSVCAAFVDFMAAHRDEIAECRCHRNDWMVTKNDGLYGRV